MCVRTGVRYVITKFSGEDSLPNFLTHGAPLRARFARARSSAIIPPTDVKQITLTLKMTTGAQVVETSVTVNNNSPIQDYVHQDDQTQPTFEMTPGFKPFTELTLFIHGNNFNLQLVYRVWATACRIATTPDKTVETFQCNFQFRAMQCSCPKGTNSPPPHPCCNVVLA